LLLEEEAKSQKETRSPSKPSVDQTLADKDKQIQKLKSVIDRERDQRQALVSTIQSNNE
jgi:hypothetical protein